MRLIKRNTDYAIQALTCISSSRGKIISVDYLVGELKMPRPFLRKIMQMLNKEGIVKSFKGKGGGFKLVVSPEDVSVYDMMTIFQGPFKLNEHILKRKVCPNVNICKLKKKLDVIEKKLKGDLQKIRISDLKKRA